MIPYEAVDVDEPTSAFPVVTVGLIVVNFIVFFYELALNDTQFNTFVSAYSLVPCEYSGQCPVYDGTPTPFFVTLFTSMFLHAGWEHIVGNMLFLFVFGTHVERSMGGLRYLAFYLICGLAADGLEIVTSLNSNVPGLGASGAISGVLAGYLRLYPGSRIKTLIPFLILYRSVNIPAWVFIGVWFLIQFFSGIGSVTGSSEGGVAYSAHIGGFLAGLLLVPLFVQAQRVDRIRTYHAI